MYGVRRQTTARFGVDGWPGRGLFGREHGSVWLIRLNWIVFNRRFRPSDDNRLTTVTSELKIAKVDRSHHLRKFTCTVKQAGEEVSAETTDTVNVQWMPTGVTITNEDTYTENSAATIVCSGSFTTLVIWSKLKLIWSWRQPRSKLSVASSKKQRNWAERRERQHLEWLVQSIWYNERHCCSVTSRLIFKCINNDSILASMSHPLDNVGSACLMALSFARIMKSNGRINWRNVSVPQIARFTNVAGYAFGY